MADLTAEDIIELYCYIAPRYRRYATWQFVEGTPPPPAESDAE